jgi:hypothetical protein
LKVRNFIFINGLNLVYFLVKGTAALVLPRLQNRPYKEIMQGEHFGHSELATDKEFIDMNKKIKRTN